MCLCVAWRCTCAYSCHRRARHSTGIISRSCCNSSETRVRPRRWIPTVAASALARARQSRHAHTAGARAPRWCRPIWLWPSTVSVRRMLPSRIPFDRWVYSVVLGTGRPGPVAVAATLVMMVVVGHHYMCVSPRLIIFKDTCCAWTPEREI